MTKIDTSLTSATNNSEINPTFNDCLMGKICELYYQSISCFIPFFCDRCDCNFEGSMSQNPSLTNYFEGYI